MIGYLKLFRWPNILITILTQVLIKVIVFDYILHGLGIGYPLSNAYFVILVLSTVFVAIAGYISNDIEDVAIDKINRPNRPLCQGIISIAQAKFLRLLFEVLGFILGFIVAYKVGYIALSGIHLTIIILMRYYAKTLKCKGLVGNLVVAFSAAMVPAIIWIFGIVGWFGVQLEVTFYFTMINTIMTFYVVFAFWFTLLRELVKDVEDLPGDQINGCSTLAVRLPFQKLKTILVLIAVVGIIGIFLFQFVLLISPGLASRLFFAINFSTINVILMVFVIPKLIAAKNPANFTKIGHTLKIIMAIGVLNLLLFIV